MEAVVARLVEATVFFVINKKVSMSILACDAKGNEQVPRLYLMFCLR